MTFNPLYSHPTRDFTILFKSFNTSSFDPSRDNNRICTDIIFDINVLNIVRDDDSTGGENGTSQCFDKQSKRLIPLNYRGRNQRHKRLFPAVCCLRIVAFPVSSSGTPVPQREREMKRERERTVDRRTERKCEGIRAWWNEAGESRAFPSKLWNLFLEETQRTRGKPGGYLSKRLRNNCSAIRMPRTKTTFHVPYTFLLFHFPSILFIGNFIRGDAPSS